MRINRTLANRLRANSIGRALLSLFMIGGNAVFGDIPHSKSPTVSERVSLVRQALAQKNDPATPQLDKQKTAAGFATEGEVAQWVNWGNWGNWANWNNWGNWANWFNH